MLNYIQILIWNISTARHNDASATKSTKNKKEREGRSGRNQATRKRIRYDKNQRGRERQAMFRAISKSIGKKAQLPRNCVARPFPGGGEGEKRCRGGYPQRGLDVVCRKPGHPANALVSTPGSFVPPSCATDPPLLARGYAPPCRMQFKPCTTLNRPPRALSDRCLYIYENSFGGPPFSLSIVRRHPSSGSPRETNADSGLFRRGEMDRALNVPRYYFF